MVEDLKDYKIKNELICIGLGFGILFLIISFPSVMILSHLFALLIPFLLLSPLFVIRAVGAGDIKLLSVIGLFLGDFIIIKVILFSIVFGGMLSIFKLIKNKNMRERLSNFATYILAKKRGQLGIYYDISKEGCKNTIHFSVSIFISLCFCLLRY